MLFRSEISELKPLEELIDLRNIHGWLQSRIQEAESRYANIVTEILAENPSVLPELEQVAYDFGADNPVETKDVASDVYRKFDDTLLNGMPCDRINVITSQDNDLYTWEQAEDIHGSYWKSCRGQPRGILQTEVKSYGRHAEKQPHQYRRKRLQPLLSGNELT